MSEFVMKPTKPRDWLKDIRLKSELTQEEVAEKSTLTQEHYCNIESGKKNASVATAKRIAKTLGFKWTKFFEEKE